MKSPGVSCGIPHPGRFRLLLNCLLFCVCTYGLLGQAGVERLFDEGNLLYQREDFAGALEKYRQIEEQGMVSAALYYNMANCYYKNGLTGHAILYYERALLLDPTDADVAANLGIANQATVDKITLPQEFALARWIRAALYVAPLTRLRYLLAVLYLLSGGTLALWILTRRPGVARIMKRSTAVLVLLMAILGLFAAGQWWDSRNRVEAIVMPAEASAMSQPGGQGVEVFTLHEGAKVRITQATEEWVEIILLDGKVGWIRRSALEVI